MNVTENKFKYLVRNFSINFNFDDIVRNISVKKIISVFVGSFFILSAYLIGSSGANLMGIIMFKPKLVNQKYVPPKIEKIDRPKKLASYKSAILGNIFNTEKAPPNLFNSQNKTMVQKSITDFELRGTMAFGFLNAYARILQKSKNASETFRVGDAIFGSNLILMKVFDSHVTLDQNGTEVELGFKDDPTFSTLATYTSTSRSAVTATKKEPIVRRVAPSVSALDINVINGKADVVINSTDIEGHLANFSGLLQQARVIPKSDETGKLKGYLIRNIEKGSLYEQIGLQNKDIIKNVNGEAIDSPEKALTLFQLLRNEKQINLILERGGQDISFTYFIQ